MLDSSSSLFTSAKSILYYLWPHIGLRLQINFLLQITYINKFIHVHNYIYTFVVQVKVYTNNIHKQVYTLSSYISADIFTLYMEFSLEIHKVHVREPNRAQYWQAQLGLFINELKMESQVRFI